MIKKMTLMVLVSMGCHAMEDKGIGRLVELGNKDVKKLTTFNTGDIVLFKTDKNGFFYKCVIIGELVLNDNYVKVYKDGDKKQKEIAQKNRLFKRV